MNVQQTMDVFVERGDYILSTYKEKLDCVMIHEWLSMNAYWAMGRFLEVVKASVANSIPFGIFLRETPAHPPKQVAFARAITDYCSFQSMKSSNC
jgi:hypothetical protein